MKLIFALLIAFNPVTFAMTCDQALEGKSKVLYDLLKYGVEHSLIDGNELRILDGTAALLNLADSVKSSALQNALEKVSAKFVGSDKQIAEITSQLAEELQADGRAVRTAKIETQNVLSPTIVTQKKILETDFFAVNTGITRSGTPFGIYSRAMQARTSFSHHRIPGELDVPTLMTITSRFGNDVAVWKNSLGLEDTASLELTNGRILMVIQDSGETYSFELVSNGLLNPLNQKRSIGRVHEIVTIAPDDKPLLVASEYRSGETSISLFDPNTLEKLPNPSIIVEDFLSKMSIRFPILIGKSGSGKVYLGNLLTGQTSQLDLTNVELFNGSIFARTDGGINWLQFNESLETTSRTIPLELSEKSTFYVRATSDDSRGVVQVDADGKSTLYYFDLDKNIVIKIDEMDRTNAHANVLISPRHPNRNFVAYYNKGLRIFDLGLQTTIFVPSSENLFGNQMRFVGEGEGLELRSLSLRGDFHHIPLFHRSSE